eukprot:Gregarina_sp_Poly_1__6291@NODE_333_length_9463_cov_335_720094_g281_i0_p5_GENE_NODE_333_length_9463_cov_335_720094_g281_i0NODE_333_length_9463_cov_335_720094_g281_i0_p5_ORF_typecomplete_len268_score40_75Integrin_beta/PF00362_18/4_5e18VWA/PF00092_28/4_1e05VWA_2/PF13519_6/0_082_NODE_333_length_9463_cov_335_720094_g281_i067547557
MYLSFLKMTITHFVLSLLLLTQSGAYEGKARHPPVFLNSTEMHTDFEDKIAADFLEIKEAAVKAFKGAAEGGGLPALRSRHTIERNVAQKDSECSVTSFDVFLVQDTTETFQSDLNSAVKLMEDWILSIQDEYEGSRFGYGTFTDKPIPLSGFGKYGGWQHVAMQYDWCFNVDQPLVADKDTFTASLRKVWKKKGSGFDFLESQLEALLRAVTSTNSGWEEVNPNTRARVVVLITDSSSHLNGDGAENIAKYNLPVVLSSASKRHSP